MLLVHDHCMFTLVSALTQIIMSALKQELCSGSHLLALTSAVSNSVCQVQSSS